MYIYIYIYVCVYEAVKITSTKGENLLSTAELFELYFMLLFFES